MRKIVCLIMVSLLVFNLSSYALAIGMGIGARAMGMGGAYTALARDITAAYWNPAGLIHSKLIIGDGMLDLGFYGNFSLADIEAIINSSDFIEDYSGKEIDLQGYMNGILGGSINKIGISIIPWGNVIFTKPSADFPLFFDARLKQSVAVTFGSSFGFPLPLPLLSPISVGANVRYVTGQLHNESWAGPGNNMFVTDATGSGIGLDIGAQADITPMITLGIVLRDILTGFPWSGKTQIYEGYFDGEPQNKLSEQDYSETEHVPTGIIVGVAADIPLIALLSADLENRGENTDIRLGAEKTILGIIAIRAGYYTNSETQTSHVTAGLGANIGPLHGDMAISQDTQTPENKAALISFSATL